MGRWYITGDITNMKRICLLASMAVLLTLAVACNKENNDNTTGDSGAIKEIATFTDLNAYIGRSDLNAIKTEFRNAGYALTEREDDFAAQKRDLTTGSQYHFEIEQGMITSAGFMHGEEGMRASGKLKSAILEKVNEEKTFSAGRTLKSYRAYVHNGSDAEQYSFTSRDEFVAWLTSAVLNEDVEGESKCTYETYKTVVIIYPDRWVITISLK